MVIVWDKNKNTGISLVQQYTAFDKYLRAGRFSPKVFVNCFVNYLQALKILNPKQKAVCKQFNSLLLSV